LLLAKLDFSVATKIILGKANNSIRGDTQEIESITLLSISCINRGVQQEKFLFI
jgi:hypothetical protein